MICPSCKCQVARRDAFCGVCGRPLKGSDQRALELVMPDGTRVPLIGILTVGRGEDNAVRVSDGSVSRRHARIVAGGGVPLVEDLGSSYGTFVNGRRIDAPAPLGDGVTVRFGDAELRVERPRGEEEAGRTLVVPAAGIAADADALATAQLEGPGTRFGFRPRVEAGFSLKRMEAGEGSRRWVLRNLKSGEIVRMGDDEAALFELLDGSMGLPDLMAEAERRFGGGGIARLTRLLSELGERGFLEGIDAAEKAQRAGLMARLSKPREKVFTGAGAFFERVYRRGAFVLFTPLGLAVLIAIAAGGLAIFAYLVIGRYGTPFVVASKVGLGGLAFLIGRFIVVAFHELAHGLTMASFGRRCSLAGVKLVFMFPFAFVDTSDGWFEPKRRRLAISAAGPASDLVVGGVFSAIALTATPGTFRDIVFQLAFAAYVGALFNLNPLLDRDGYHMLVDWLQQPGLRQKAREYTMRRLSGKPVRADAPRSLAIYGGLTLVWMVAAIGFVIIMSVLFYDQMVAIAPKEVVWMVLGAFYLLLFVPVALVFGKPLRERWRARRAEVAGAS